MSATIYAAVTALLVSSLPCDSRTLASVEFDDLAKHVSQIAVVTVDAGQRITAADGTLCGFRYRAAIDQPVKGPQTSKTIDFYSNMRRTVGSQMLLFLSQAGTKFDYSFLPFSYLGPRPEELVWRSKCEPLLPELRESYDGLASLDIVEDLKADQFVRLHIPTPHRLPKGVKFAPEPSTQFFEGTPFGSVLVPVSSLIEFLLNPTGAR